MCILFWSEPPVLEIEATETLWCKKVRWDIKKPWMFMDKEMFE